MRWADIVLLEDNGIYMSEMDGWRRQGVKIVGGNQDSASWEIDRARGMRVFRKAGIAVPPYREFESYDDAIAFTKRRGEPFAAKPCAAVDDKSLSYVAKSADDLVFMDHSHLRPADLRAETRIVAARLYMRTPDEFFHRHASGRKLIAEVLARPDFAAAPPPLQAVGHLAAAEAARGRSDSDELTHLKQVVALAPRHQRWITSVSVNP